MSLASAQPPPARPRPSVSAPSDLVFGAALFALAWAVRLYVAFRFAGEPVWDGHYRVNVVVGPDVLATRIAHSYLLEVAPDGRILSAAPPLARRYP